jgi:4a-hydroxytetrahydrobiopterin dehydratase
MTDPLSSADLTTALTMLPGWSLDGTHITKTFIFQSFPEAFAFMTRVAFAAEAIQHHPDWRNIYNRVIIRLSTHDSGDAITENDLTLARAIQGISWVG